MITWFLLILGTLLIAFGVYKVCVMPTKKTSAAFRQLFGKRTLRQKVYAIFVHPLAKVISKSVSLSAYKKRRLISELRRAGIDKTPELYIGENLSQSTWVGVIGFLFIPLGLPFVSVLLIIYAVMLYRKNSVSIQKTIAKIDREIEAELPRMVETLNYTLGDNNDLLNFFERYRRVAGIAMGKALDRLILSMKTGNAENALREFDHELAIPQISVLVSTLLGIMQGTDHRTTLLVLEKDFRTRQRELIRRETNKRSDKVRLASVIMVFGMALLMLVPLIIMVVQMLGETGVL